MNYIKLYFIIFNGIFEDFNELISQLLLLPMYTVINVSKALVLRLTGKQTEKINLFVVCYNFSLCS